MEFIKGADVSSLQAMEDYGAKFYDLNGNEADALAILQGHGVNYIRLRLFHQPTRSFDGGDYCDLPPYSSYGETDQSARAGLPFGFPLQ